MHFLKENRELIKKKKHYPILYFSMCVCVSGEHLYHTTPGVGCEAVPELTTGRTKKGNEIFGLPSSSC